jgi:hypothetical protein
VNLRGRLDRLDKLIPPLPEPSKEQRSAEGLAAMLFEAIETASLTDEEAAKVSASLRAEVDRGPYAEWFRALREGWCRIPEVTPAAMRAVMLAYADQPTSNSPALVCNGCGMFLPRDFGPCPVCRTEKDRNWPWLARGTARWTHLDRHLNASERVAG